jgi:hypothetical protein
MKVNRPFQSTRRKSFSANMQATTERVPRVARLMALAIYFDQLLRDGVVADQAELARLGKVTRARVTQILDLSNLTPSIQDALLLRPHHGITERKLRPVAALADWRQQERLWERITTV